MMYPSSNNTLFPQDNNIYQTQSFSSSSFVLPLEDEAVFCEFLKQQQFFSNDHNYNNSIMQAHEMTNNIDLTMGECSNSIGNHVAIDINDGDDDQWDVNNNHNNTQMEPESNSPRKKSSKRDRHSKINTARGPRDRRMRLSLDVAKKLFGLQDLLGFDKASEAVDWLITKSKPSILELIPDPSSSFMGVSNSASSTYTSECEILSETVDQSMVKTSDNDDTKTTENKAKKQKEKINKGIRRCVDFHHPLAKETRERARVRARERTILKKNNKLGNDDSDQVSNFRPYLDQDVNQLGFWSPNSEERQCQRNEQSMSLNSQTNPGLVGDNSSLLMTDNWSPNYLFNYHHKFGQHEHDQLNDYQINGKAWEVNYN